jgi:hypothetical protein
MNKLLTFALALTFTASMSMFAQSGAQTSTGNRITGGRLCWAELRAKVILIADG